MNQQIEFSLLFFITVEKSWIRMSRVKRRVRFIGGVYRRQWTVSTGRLQEKWLAMLKQRWLLLQWIVSRLGFAVRTGLGLRWRGCWRSVLRTVQQQGLNKWTLRNRCQWTLREMRA